MKIFLINLKERYIVGIAVEVTATVSLLNRTFLDRLFTARLFRLYRQGRIALKL